MKKFKKIFLIISVVCFLVLFVSPRPSSAFAEGGETFNGFSDSVIETAYNTTSEWFDYMKSGTSELFDEVLNEFSTYAYIGTKSRSYVDGEFVETERRYCLNVRSVQNFGSYTQWVCSGAGTCYYDSTSLFPTFSSQTVRVYSNRLEVTGTSYYFESDFETHNRIVTYCDLPQTYFTQHTDASSLVTLNLSHFPPPDYGTISSQGGNLGDNVQDTLDRWQPPEPETLPPFSPPETLPPATLPPDVLTIYPPVTYSDGSFLIDYQPYIYGDFFPITTTQDDTIITASGSIIAYSWEMLTANEQIKSVILLFLVLSLVLGLLT